MSNPLNKLTFEISFHELVLLTRSLENTIKMLDTENVILLELPRENQNTVMENIRQRNIAQLYKAAFTEKWQEAMVKNPELDPDGEPGELYLLDHRHYFK
ncbi:hypothetical protein ACFLU5_12115 [Bacteroidota bacterium]